MTDSQCVPVLHPGYAIDGGLEQPRSLAVGYSRTACIRSGAQRDGGRPESPRAAQLFR
jgi:hypothetical protein